MICRWTLLMFPMSCCANVLPWRKQYAAPSCSGRVTGHSFTDNFECVPPNNFMGQHWLKAFCHEAGGNVTFEKYAGQDCTGQVLSAETFPSGCSLCADPPYTCYGGGLRSLSIKCVSAAGGLGASAVMQWWRFFSLLWLSSFCPAAY